MNENYNDILSRIAEPPSWYDENGTPRYGEFNPNMCPNIYSRVVCLFKIACQACDKIFLVEMHDDAFGWRHEFPPKKWHYGDPPIHGCVGDSMNCEDLEVLQAWTKKMLEDWQRQTELEGVIDL